MDSRLFNLMTARSAQELPPTADKPQPKKENVMYAYPRNYIPVDKNMLRRFAPNLDLTTLTKVEPLLAKLDKLSVISRPFLLRLVSGMVDETTGINDTGEFYELIAQRFGYHRWKKMEKQRTSLEKAKEAAEANRLIVREIEKKASTSHIAETKSKRNTPFQSRAVFIQQLFHENTVYLLAIEEVLKTYSDEHLDEANRRYEKRVKLSNEELQASFGMFFKVILHLPEVKARVVSVEDIKKLARMLFFWHFRRFITPSVMVPICKKLPRQYRIDRYHSWMISGLTQMECDDDITPLDFYADIDEEEEDAE